MVKQLLQEPLSEHGALRLPRESSRGPSGGHARRSSSRKRYVLRLPRERKPRPQRRPRPAAARPCRRLCVLRLLERQPRPRGHARRSSSRRLCVLRLPHESVLRLPRERQPRPQRRPRAPQLVQEALCILRLLHERQPRPQRRPRAPQLLLETLCTARATRKAARKLSVQ